MSLRLVGIGDVSCLMLPSAGLAFPVANARLLLHSAWGMPVPGRDVRLGSGAGPVLVGV